MSNPLSDLGRSLATSYSAELSKWSFLELSSMRDDLSASFSHAADITRLEEKWLSFATLIQTLQTDMIPQDLLAGADPPALPREDQDLPAGFSRKGESDPPVSTPGSSDLSSLPDLPVEAKEWQVENKAPERTDYHIPGPLSGLPGWLPNLSPATRNSNLPFRFHQNSDFQEAAINPADTKTEYVKPGQRNLHGEVPASVTSRSNDWLMPEEHASPQAVLPRPSELPGSTSDSIWNQPLNNLGDMASVFGNSSTEKSALASLPGTSRIVEGDPYLSPGKYPGLADNKPSHLPVNLPSTKGPDAQSDLVQPDAWNLFFTPAQIPGAHILGPSADPETPNVPDTDDLLDALTERVIRDFRRYYP